MKYILNVPQVPQKEFENANILAETLVGMNKAINPAVVADRIEQLGEADVLMFGNVSVIAIVDHEQSDSLKKVAAPVAPLVLERQEPLVPVVVEKEVAIEQNRATPTVEKRGGRATPG